MADKLIPTGDAEFVNEDNSDKSSRYAAGAKVDDAADPTYGEPRHGSTVTTTRKASVAALLRNPLAGMSEGETIADVDDFVARRGLATYRETFRKGALLARVNQRADGFEYLDALSEEEKGVLRREVTRRWDQPKMLYFLVVLCAGSAIVQGMDQTAVNGAQVSFTNLDLGSRCVSSSLTCEQSGLLLPRIRHHE